jgi:hypothetical protein
MTTPHITTNYILWDDLTHYRGGHELPMVLWDAAVRRQLDPAEFPAALAEAWSSHDAPESALPTNEWVGFFSEAGFTINSAAAERPAEPLTLFRGTTPGRRRRMSWTEDRELAQFFADRTERFGLVAHVYTAVVEPVQLLARITDIRPGESEWVVNTVGLKIARAKFATK